MCVYPNDDLNANGHFLARWTDAVEKAAQVTWCVSTLAE
jgi:hypothetical protein